MLRRFRDGDRATLESLYRLHAPAIGRMARAGFSFTSRGAAQRFRGFNDVADQQNLIQETFLRAFGEGGRRGYDGITPYERYLRGIARNVVIDLFRNRAASLTVFDVSLAEAQPDDQPEPGERIDRAALEEAVRRFTDELPRREQQLVALRFRDGLTQEQAAKRLKTRRATVRTLERRVREKLVASLTKAGLLEAEGRTSLGLLMVLA